MLIEGKTSCIFLFTFTLTFLALYTTFYHQLRRLPSGGTATSSNRNTLHYRDTFIYAASNETVAAYLWDLTLHPHLAGTPLSLSTALYVHTQFQSLGLTTHFVNFSCLLSYPKHASLSAHFGDGTILSVSLAEPNVPQNGAVRPYHAYSPSGSAYGESVFLNYGREQDYNELAVLGVEVKGCVGILRRGGEMSRYVAVENAAAHGLAAVLMYTEGGDDRYREGVERGTVMNGLGDPLSPGWAGVEGGEKLGSNDPKVKEKFPRIPSLPVSEAAVESILTSLEEAKVPYEWRNIFKSGGRTSKRVGPGPIMLNLTYEGEQKTANIHNVFAIIRGTEEPDRFVLLGNHRDAWTFGAVDPNSGTAALLDIARRYALLLRSGWNPRRTIILCSWDAEEFGMVGSSEWVEQNYANLGSKVVAYFNVDCAVQGPGLFVSATPQLDDLLVEVLKKIKDPDSGNAFLYEQWMAANKGVNIQRLSRVDSDFAPFLQNVGIPSVDLYFGSDFPVYHTAFDSYGWMANFGDPSFQRHVAVAGVWGLVSLHLADDPILPFNYVSYAGELLEYENVLNSMLEGTVSSQPIAAAVEEFAHAAADSEEEAKKLRGDQSPDESSILRRRMLNDRLMLAERGFIDSEGLTGRPWFKHLVYGPHGDSESNISFFPGIADALSQKMKEEERETILRHEIWRVARAIQRAAYALRGELT